MTAHEAEAAVVGGGPAGAVAALTLARGGRRVLLIDDAAPGRPALGEALPPAANPLLRDLGVPWPPEGDTHLPCHGNLAAWGAQDLHATDFLFDPHGPGWHLDRTRFDALLRRTAAEAGAHLARGRVTAVTREEDGTWRLLLQGAAGEIRCRWLVDATGRRASVARLVGAVRRRSDRLVAFHARFRSAEGAPPDRDARTLVEAEPGGWWYAARVPGGERVVAFLTDADLADPTALRAREGFLTQAEKSPHVQRLLAEHGYAMVGRPRGADASSARLLAPTGDGWLATGDAALSFDPLSSQGLLNALFTGMITGETVAAALAGDREAGATYAEQLLGIHRAYRAHHALYYAAETRWPDHSFWQRRGPRAGLAGSDAGVAAHVAEAIQYRALDRAAWAG